MYEEPKFFVCEVCGNLVGMIHSSGDSDDVLWKENDRAKSEHLRRCSGKTCSSSETGRQQGDSAGWRCAAPNDRGTPYCLGISPY